MTTAEATAAVECPHLHRVIETPNGAFVNGVCKACGDVREYPSSSYTLAPDEYNKQQQAQRAANSVAARAKKKKSAFNAGPLSPKNDQSYVLPVHEPVREKSRAARPAGRYYQHPMTPQQSALLAYVKAHGTVGTREASDALDEDLTLTGVRMRALVSRGFLERVEQRSAAGAFKYRAAIPAAPPAARGKDASYVVSSDGLGGGANGT